MKPKKKESMKRKHYDLPEPSAMVRIKLESVETAQAEEPSCETPPAVRRRPGRPPKSSDSWQPPAKPPTQSAPRRVMPELLKCSRCPAKLNNADNLRKHEMVHDGAKPIYCNRCEERFMTCAELQAHYRTHPGALVTVNRAKKPPELKRDAPTVVRATQVAVAAQDSAVSLTQASRVPQSRVDRASTAAETGRSAVVTQSSACLQGAAGLTPALVSEAQPKAPPSPASVVPTVPEARVPSGPAAVERSEAGAAAAEGAASAPPVTAPTAGSPGDGEAARQQVPRMETVHQDGEDEPLAARLKQGRPSIPTQPTGGDQDDAPLAARIKIGRPRISTRQFKQTTTKPVNVSSTPGRKPRSVSCEGDAPRRRTRGQPTTSTTTEATSEEAAVYACSRCPEKWTTAENLRKHQMSHDGAKPVFCEKCDSRFMTVGALKLHENTHTDARPYACDKCDKAYNDPSVLLRHKQSAHMGVRHSCKLCSRTYMTRAGLLHHNHRRHKPKQSWPCPLCHKVFPLERYRNKHMESLHVKVELDQMPQCPICHKKFKWQSYLATHIRLHSGQKPYPCRECGRRFSEPGHRRTHELTHLPYAQRPHQCHLCFKRFIQHGALSRHVRTHTGEKPYACALCPVRFSDQSALYRHKRMHDSAAPRKERRPARKQPRRKKAVVKRVEAEENGRCKDGEETKRMRPGRSIYVEPESDEESDEDMEPALVSAVVPECPLQVGRVVGTVIESVKPGLGGVRLKRRRESDCPGAVLQTD